MSADGQRLSFYAMQVAQLIVNPRFWFAYTAIPALELNWYQYRLGHGQVCIFLGESKCQKVNKKVIVKRRNPSNWKNLFNPRDPLSHRTQEQPFLQMGKRDNEHS